MIYNIEEETPGNLTWAEGDKWYGWSYSSVKKRYYFDDIGNESIMGLWEDLWKREEAQKAAEVIPIQYNRFIWVILGT